MGSIRTLHSHGIKFAVAAAGATSIASQIILMREFFAVFYGNELSVGLVLAIWLVCGSAGSILIGRVSLRRVSIAALFAIFQGAIAIILPLSILEARSIKHVFGVLPGQLLGMWNLVVSALVILSPLCILLGSLFTLGCTLYKSHKPHLRTGGTFLVESIGSACGGLLVSLVLIRFFNNLAIASALSFINLASAYAVSREIKDGALSRAFLKVLLPVLMVLTLALYPMGLIERLDAVSLKKEFPHLEIECSRTSVYGTIVAVKKGVQTSFFTNGLRTFTYPDRFTSEETVHFSMLTHRDPRRVLLIGGGAGGTLEELLKYPVEGIDYIELDPALIETARQVLRSYSAAYLDNPKVRVVTMDGRFFVKNTASRYDVIIIDLPNPYTAQINRFYTKEFYGETARILNEGGIVSFALTASESYIGQDLSRFLSSLYWTARSIFPDVSLVPGDRVIFLLSKRRGATEFDSRTFLQRLRERNIPTQYVREYYLDTRLSRRNRDYLRSRLDESGKVKVNLDFAPISYYYDLVLWASYFNDLFSIALRNLRGEWMWLALICGVGLILAALARAHARGRVLCAIGVVGFSQIAFEILVILLFQVLYGYVYERLGLIITLFMVGLSIGSVFMLRRLERVRDPMKSLRSLVMSVVLYLALTPFLASVLQASRGRLLQTAGGIVIAGLLPFVSGFIGGASFQAANKIYLHGLRDDAAAAASGVLYGVDLIGSAIGAMAVSALLVPVVGIYETCEMVLILNVSVLVLLSVKDRRQVRSA